MLHADHDRAIRAYLDAKDHGVLPRFAEAFLPDARFVSHFDFETDFGSEEPCIGLPAISEALGQLTVGYAHVRTLCTPESVKTDGDVVTLDWIVGMTERELGIKQVAWGDYRWTFDRGTGLARDLVVVMRAMAVLEAEHAPAVDAWLDALPCPWCAGPQLLAELPPLPQLQGAAAFFG